MVQIRINHKKWQNSTTKIWNATGQKDFDWFHTFYYPTQRFVMEIPHYKDSNLQSITIRSKLNISLEVRFQDKEHFRRTFSFREQAKQTGSKMKIDDDENHKKLLKNYHLTFR